eukprot:2063461-Lingulodinium_polyedra.AAC.1
MCAVEPRGGFSGRQGRRPPGVHRCLRQGRLSGRSDEPGFVGLPPEHSTTPAELGGAQSRWSA